MNHTHDIPQSPFGAGTRYDNAGKHIVTPEVEQRKPRISRIAGEMVVRNVVQVGRSKPEVPQQDDEPWLDAWALATQHEADANGYAGVASRQMDLERAEAVNIERAAKQAGMTVDQWRASGRHL